MHFISAGNIIGPKHKIRSITLEGAPSLPDGEYTFIEFYCTDAICDCRKTIIHIHHNGYHVSTINYGWESPKYYAKWSGIDDEISREMSGLSIDFTSPDEIDPDASIALLQKLLDEQYISKLKSTYKQVRTTIAKQNIIISHDQPKLSRNAPCHCGSGKKHKRCCIDLTPEIQHQDIIPFPNPSPDITE
ncbi:MAG: hypothetical protein ACI9E1_001889 [Cryomorphaceae bacterium]|jgi:uncharacterized protein YchJ